MKWLTYTLLRPLPGIFIVSNCNCYPLLWFITSKKSLTRIENFPKRVLSLFIIVATVLIMIFWKSLVIKLRNYRTMWTRIFTVINNLSPNFVTFLN